MQQITLSGHLVDKACDLCCCLLLQYEALGFMRLSLGCSDSKSPFSDFL